MKRQHLLMVALVLVSLFGVVMTPMAQSGGEVITPVNIEQSAAWLASYYANENLEGNPVAIQTENTPSHNWDIAVPVPAAPADHWSARWTRTMTLTPGQYRLSVTADDGVRVYVNGSLLINEWHGFISTTYTADFTIFDQQQAFTIEFYDGMRQAYLNVGLARIDTQPPVISSQTNATIQLELVNAYIQPSTASSVQAVLRRGAIYPVVNITADNIWVQLNANGMLVWVFRSYVFLSTTSVSQPSTPMPPALPSDYPTATVNTNVLNVRAEPDVGSPTLTQIRLGETYTVRRGSINGWLQLIINGDVGWVSDDFVTLRNPTNLVYLAGTAEAEILAIRLNVRSRPDISGQVVVKVNRGESHAIVGRNASNTWILLDVNGTFGWVNRDYVDITALFDLPIVNDIPPVIPPATDYILVTITPYPVKLRQGPGTQFPDLGTVPRGTDAKVVGRTFDNNWWQIDYNGVRGWVAASFSRIQENAVIDSIPVTLT